MLTIRVHLRQPIRGVSCQLKVPSAPIELEAPTPSCNPPSDLLTPTVLRSDRWWQPPALRGVHGTSLQQQRAWVVHVVKQGGSVPLCRAAERGHTEMCRLLLDHRTTHELEQRGFMLLRFWGAPLRSVHCLTAEARTKPMMRGQHRCISPH